MQKDTETLSHYYQWLRSPFQEETSIDKTASSNKWLAEPPKRSGPPLLNKRPPPETGNRDSTPQTVPRVLQSPLPGPKTRKQVYACHKPQPFEHLKHRRVGVLNRPLEHLPPCTHSPKVKEISEVPLHGCLLPIQGSPLRSSNHPSTL